MNSVTLSCVVITVAIYVLARHIAKCYPSPFTTPVFLSTALIVTLLLAWDTTYAEYVPAKEWMIFLLGPATVALAVPIYKNRQALAAHLVPGIVGVVSGVASTIIAAVLLGYLFRLGTEVLVPLTVKSVTAPIAVELVVILHGDPALAAILVIVAGMLGVMFGPWLMDRAGINNPLARGLALGTISHGQGTAHAIKEGELQGAIAAISMGLSAVVTAFVLPKSVPFLIY